MWGRPLQVLLACELWLALAWLASPSLDLDPRAGYLIGFLSVGASAVACAATFPSLRPRALVALLAPCALLWVASQLRIGLPDALIVTAALLIGGCLLGTVIGALVEHPGQLLFVAIVSSAADAGSVLHPSGPSAAIAQAPAVLSLVALPWPMLGTHAIEPFLGVNDVVFTALYLSASRRHELVVVRTALALLGAYALTALIVIVWERPVPVLPLLGLAVVLAQPRARAPRPEERRRGYTVALLAVAVVIVVLMR